VSQVDSEPALVTACSDAMSSRVASRLGCELATLTRLMEEAVSRCPSGALTFDALNAKSSGH